MIRFFEDVPLLDQQWIDAYTVVLAEWSALLLQQGYQLGNADPHQLACVIPLKTNGAELLTPSTSADRTEAARRRVTAMLAKFEGRARTIEGRIYFTLTIMFAGKGAKPNARLIMMGLLSLPGTTGSRRAGMEQRPNWTESGSRRSLFGFPHSSVVPTARKLPDSNAVVQTRALDPTAPAPLTENCTPATRALRRSGNRLVQLPQGRAACVRGLGCRMGPSHRVPVPE